MGVFDKSKFYIDFSDRDNLTTEEKIALEKIQETLRPIERIDVLLDYIVNCKITSEDWEVMTGLPYTYNDDLC